MHVGQGMDTTDDMHRDLREIFAMVKHCPVSACFQTHQHFGKCGFAAAGFTDDGDRLSLPGSEVQLLIGLDIPDSFTAD